MLIPSPSRTRRVVVGIAASRAETLPSGAAHARR